MAKQGVFIVFEGIDGSGKSTHVNLLSKELIDKNYKVLTTSEPTKGWVGSFIRKYSKRKGKRLPPETEALLFAADRYEHVKDLIIPALKKRRIVISDRYVYSSIAYQGAAGVDMNWIRDINSFAPKPDIAILFDILPEFSLSRVKREKTVFEESDYLRRVRENYLKFVRSGELIKIEVDKPRMKVQEKISNIVMRFLEKKFL